jgi:hypothetical protein
LKFALSGPTGLPDFSVPLPGVLNSIEKPQHIAIIAVTTIRGSFPTAENPNRELT